MERSTRKIALVGIILLVVGLIAWIMQLTGGLLAGSNMTNVFLWGLMIAVFAFLVGFGAGSQFVASAIILSGKEELKPLARIAGACGLACVCAAGVAILADLGAIRNALAMIVGMNAFSAGLGHDCHVYVHRALDRAAGHDRARCAFREGVGSACWPCGTCASDRRRAAFLHANRAWLVGNADHAR